MRAVQCRSRQSGVTLIEMMIALAIGLVIILAAVAGVIVAKRGFLTLDAASQLRDNTRFASEIISRIVVQNGYKDVPYAIASTPATPLPVTADPSIIGFDNAVLPTTLPTAGDPLASVSSGNRGSAGCAQSTDTACANGSDVLVLRYQTSEGIAGSGVADGAIVNCNGVADTTAPASLNTYTESIFHVAVGAGGEPSLMCTAKDASGNWKTQPIVQGVEGFQVLYGTDAVTPGAPPTGAQDSVPDQMLRADQIIVPGNLSATNDAWRRVRSVRIGLLVRGPINSAQDVLGGVHPYFPLGQALASSSDVGSSLTPLADGRLRQVATFTVHLRNPQGQ